MATQSHVACDRNIALSGCVAVVGLVALASTWDIESTVDPECDSPDPEGDCGTAASGGAACGGEASLANANTGVAFSSGCIGSSGV